MTSLLAAPNVVAPTYLTRPPAETSGGPEAAVLAASAGLFLDPWQDFTVEVVFAERPDGTWAARIVVLIVPRQNGKGSILECVELTHLFMVESTRLIIHSAHEFATSTEHMDRLLWLIDETPDLKKRVARGGVKRSHGQESITLIDGSRIKFKTRTKGGGRGFSGDLVVLDEAMILPPKAVSALVPTLSAMPNPQIIVTGSAPLEGPESDVLRGLAKQGRVGVDDLAYLEWCCEEGADLDDPENHQRANPGYPERIGPRAIAAERKMMILDPDGFARERLGIWSETEGAPSKIPAKAWRDCEVDAADAGMDASSRVVFALDMPPDRSVVSFAACGTSSVGGLHVELVDQTSDGDAVARAAALVGAHGGTVVIAGGSPAMSLEADLVAAGLKVRTVPPAEHAQACGDLLDAVNAGDVHHYGPHAEIAGLDAAVKAAVEKPLGDAWLWDRRKSTDDISPLVAVTLARWVFKADLPEEVFAAVY